MITEPGLVYGMDECAYHADRSLSPGLGRSLSASGAKTLLRSTERFAYARDHGTVSSPSMDFGTLVHTLVLRSKDQRVVVSPYERHDTNAAKAWKGRMEREGRIIVTAKSVRKAIDVARAVHAHPVAGPLLAPGASEVSMYWIDPGTGITCRGRVDRLTPAGIIDLKTTGRESGSEPGPFGKQAANLDYPMSAAHYVDGYAELTGVVLPYFTVIVETEAPYWVRVYEYDDETLDVGRARMELAKAIFAQRSAWGDWSETPVVETLDVPGWYGRV